MALRPPSQYSGAAPGGPGPARGGGPLEHELAAEKAATLGRTGDTVVRALAALRATQAGTQDNQIALKAAVDAVYAYFIQRELCGMRRHQDVIREYGIPAAVLNRLGAS